MQYKGFVGYIVYDQHASQFYGRVIGMKREHFITFQGSTMQELELAFRDLVDDYIDDCHGRGEKAERLHYVNA